MGPGGEADGANGHHGGLAVDAGSNANGGGVALNGGNTNDISGGVALNGGQDQTTLRLVDVVPVIKNKIICRI